LAKKTTDRRKQKAPGESTTNRCGLCGKSTNLVQTECCGQWICDDEGKYVLFSYSRKSCSRNHGRFTLCASHHAEGHPGAWQDCARCRDAFETEMYVYYGTNDYNFTKLENPPAFEPTKCGKCRVVIKLGEGGYSMHRGRYWCGECSAK
jgi:hypothetical protein